MKKLLLLACFINHFGNVFSQNGFYIAPVFQKKYSTTSNNPYNFTTPQNLSINIQPKNLYSNIGFDIGVLTGYRTKNVFFETGWVQDQSGQAFKVNTSVYNHFGADSGYYNSQIYNHVSMMFNKFPLHFGLKIAGSDSLKTHKKLKWNLFLFGGFDFFSRPPIGISVGSTSILYTNPKLDSIIIDSDFINIGRRYLMYTLGLTLKGYNKKGQNIINFGLHYTQGRRYEYSSGTKVVVTNVDGYQYRHYLYSRGSGFYFTVSKDIYPFAKRKKKIADLQNDYKR